MILALVMRPARGGSLGRSATAPVRLRRRPVSPGPGRCPGSAALLSLDVIGGAAPYLAVMGTDASGSRPAAIPIPHDLTLVGARGRARRRRRASRRSPAPSIQVALSNVVGTWVQDYAVLDLAHASALADRMGGISIDLPAPEATSAGVVGPGTVKVTGAQLRALLRRGAGIRTGGGRRC